MSNDLNKVATLKLMWLLIHLHVSSSQGKSFLWNVLANINRHVIETILKNLVKLFEINMPLSFIDCADNSYTFCATTDSCYKYHSEG